MFPLSDQATAAGIGNPPQGTENRVAVRDCHGAATVLRPNPFWSRCHLRTGERLTIARYYTMNSEQGGEFARDATFVM